MKDATITIRVGQTGDVVVVSGHRTGARERLGEIREVLGEADHPRYRVRWADDSETIFYPGSDATIRRSRTRARDLRRT